MKVSEIIEVLGKAKVKGSSSAVFSAITFDSGKVSDGCLFVAVRGTRADGHDYIPMALKNGANVVVCEALPADQPEKVTFILVDDSRRALGLIASAYYGDPSGEIKVIGVTGTNGKTTIASLLYKVHMELGYGTGLLSTIEVCINRSTFPATHTTPDPVQIHAYLRQMVDEGCEYCFMEVSSHAIDQDRIAGIAFTGGIFTNLTHEHLDYHGDFAAYLSAKKRFFDHLGKDAFALVNRDDRHGAVMVQNTHAFKYTYSLRGMADFNGKIIEMLMDGTQMTINGEDIWIRLPGRFNAGNMLAVFGASILCGHEKEEVLRTLSGIGPVRGRFQTVRGRENITAVIDYAHTPDALLNVLTTIADVNKKGTQLITVVGAGGNRDRTKRPKMAVIAANHSDRVILTSDNPRFEDPESIIAEMAEGLNESQKAHTLSIVNREEAIKTACMMANPGDIILVAGKGHENYQEIKGERFPFDDIKITERYIK